MRSYCYITALAGSLVLVGAPASAQPGITLEEIVVTARKREESMLEVPVSISVISASLIQEAGIIEPRDFFELTPGLDFDTNGDRNNATPSVRGIQSTATATTRQKVMSFIDGMPLVGAQGTMQFAGVERIEVFRGPQSAAFGRSTFAGAINYVTRDPGDEFEGDLRIGTSDLGRNNITLALSGPINDTFGYAIDANFDEYRGDDSWFTTDGNREGGTSTEYISGKLTFAPNDRFDGEIRVMSMRTEDDMTLRYYISAEEYANCTSAANGGFASPNINGTRWIDGTFDCDPSAPVGGIQTNTDVAIGFTDPAAIELAETFNIDIPGETNDRDRIQGEFNFNFDSGDLQVLSFYSEESYLRWADNDRSNRPLNIDVNNGVAMVAMGPMTVSHMADPTDIEEKMLEVRWLSPGENRLRWTAGASVYDYDFLTLVWSQYADILSGQQEALSIQPNVIISEQSTNTAVFANLTYDLTERMTFSIEGRYQEEEMTNVNQVTDESFTNTTTSFVPRIALNYSFDNGVTVYAQIAEGINPAGVIPAARSPRIVAAHEQVFDLGMVEWQLESILFYEQEEIINYEVGIKAGVFENRVQLAAAAYIMDWSHYNQAYTVNFNVNTLCLEQGVPCPGQLPGLNNGDYMIRAQLDLGDANVMGIEGEATWYINDNWDMRGTLTWQETEYETFCDPNAVQRIGLTPTNTVGDGSGVLFNCVSVIGNEFSRQPDLAYTLAATYRAPLANTDWNWVARLDYRNIGEQWLDDTNLMALPVTETLNASVNFRNNNWDFRLYARNLTDNDTPRIVQSGTDRNPTPAGVQNFNVLPRDPREIGVSLSYGF
ncbi:MAG: TonB-dependent receptor [Proteobacteria bacterium]|nr:TonB-dependent receptor [Pseudomonadota bacterium]